MKTIEYLKKEKRPLKFMNYLWLSGIRKRDIENFLSFTKMIKLNNDNISTYMLAKILKRSYMTIHGWRYKNRSPKLFYWLESFLENENLKPDHVWLWINLGLRIKPEGKPIQIPLKIKEWKDISKVLSQLQPKKNNISLSKDECFAFVLGMMIGDVGKLSKNRDRLDLQLSKIYDTNKLLGKFFCDCLLKLGFEAHRIKDNRNKFRWQSQSSPFFKWIYNIVLSLKDNETTTYNSIRSEWLLYAPKNIIKRFLQGVFESDGSVLYDSKITCAVDPNIKIIQKLLNRFNIKSHIVNDKNWKRIGIEGFPQIKKCHNILFIPEIRTKRYLRLEKIINARRVKPPQKIPKYIKDKVIELGKEYKAYKIIKILLTKYNFHLSRKTINKILKK